MRITATDRSLVLEDANGQHRAIHPFWLRERSTEPESLDRLTEQRLFNPPDLDPDLHIVSVEPAGPDAWRVRFSDGHRTHFTAASILAEAPLVPGRDGLPERIPWDARLAPLAVIDWPAAADHATLLSACASLLRFGFIRLRGVPSRHQEVLRVASLFGYARETNFGTVFDVRSVPDASDLAYTSLALDPHTDNPYRAPVPGVQLLHCLTNQTSGGLSTLVDGLAVANALAAEDSDAFQTLTRTPVRFRYVDAGTEHVAWAPLIACGVDGGFEAMQVSPRLDFVPLLDAHELGRFYRARHLLHRMLKSPSFELRFRLDDGDLIMFDNGRCPHGRTAYAVAEGERHLQGCYIDIDGPRSLYRVLSRERVAS